MKISKKTPALDLKNVSKTFGKTKAVRDVSLSIDQGEIFGLLGPNAAGKSTTIHMSCGVCKIGSGEIKIFGFDVKKQFQTTRRLTGVVHQELVTDNYLPIGQTLKIHSGFYGVKDAPQWRQTLIDRLQLRPHLKKTMVKLSGGMKRRMMIAKALIHRPRLLILDEPTAGVDVELRYGLWEFIREMNRQGVTILLTTHYLEEAENICQRVAILLEGKIVALSKTKDLIQKLQNKRIHLWLQNPMKQVPSFLSAWKTHLDCEGYRLTAWVPYQEGVGKILKLIFQKEIPLKDVQTEELSLEEAFLKITQHAHQKRRKPIVS